MSDMYVMKNTICMNIYINTYVYRLCQASMKAHIIEFQWLFSIGGLRCPIY